MALVSNTKYGNMVELADETSTPTGSVALYAKAAGSGNNEHLVLYAPTASFTGDVHVTGTLHVEGTINSVNRNETNLIVDDKTITVASGSSAEGDVDGAGINFGGTGDSAFASLLFEKDNLGGSSHHLLSSTAFKATGEIHGTTLSGSGPIKTADAIESVGNMRSEGNVTAEGNLAAVGGNLTVGSYGLTNAGALTIASMAGNWTNAGREVADMGTVTTMVLNGGTANGVTIGGATPAAGTFTALVAEGNVDLGNATSDTITATGRFDSNLVPSTDSTRALGTSDRQWLEIHVDTGNIDQLGSALDCNSQAMTNVDINSGNIDNTAIGQETQAAGSFTTLSGSVILGAAMKIDAGSTPTAGVIITGSFGVMGSGGEAFMYDMSDDKIAIGAEMTSSNGALFSAGLNSTTLSASSNLQVGGTSDFDGAVTMDNTLAVAGNFSVGSYGLTNAGALTIASMAGNWTNAGREVADMGTVTTMVLNGGTANGVTIGGATPAAGTFTALVAEGNVDLGNATSDTITATGRFDSNLVPSTDSTRALGTSDRQWLEIHVDVGHIDQLGSALDCNNQAMTNVDINGGAIDGTAIGAASRSSVACTTLDANGNVTLGSDTSDTVTINGTVGNFAAGTITGTEFVATSDARLKTNIQGVTNAMDVINSIQGVEYELTENGQHSMGVLAQDLIEVAPSLVKTRENGNYAVNYSGLSAFFVEAIKEQQAQIEDLKNTVKELSK